MSIQADVVMVLQDPKVNHIDFHLGGLHVNAARLHAVAKAIKAGRITIAVQPRGPLLSAAYSPHPNRMTIGRNAVSTTIGRAGILHESVHALVDLFRCTSTTVLTDEAAAYLAEGIFLRRAHTTVRGDAAAMAIYKLAGGLIERHNMHRVKGTRLPWAEYAPLRRTIQAHPAYRTIGWRQLTSGHGVP